MWFNKLSLSFRTIHKKKEVDVMSFINLINVDVDVDVDVEFRKNLNKTALGKSRGLD